MVRTKHLPGRPSVGVTASLLIALLGNAPQRGFHVPEWSQRHDGHLAPPRGCMCQSCFLTHAFYLIWNHPSISPEDCLVSSWELFPPVSDDIGEIGLE